MKNSKYHQRCGFCQESLSLSFSLFYFCACLQDGVFVAFCYLLLSQLKWNKQTKPKIQVSFFQGKKTKQTKNCTKSVEASSSPSVSIFPSSFPGRDRNQKISQLFTHLQSSELPNLYNIKTSNYVDRLRFSASMLFGCARCQCVHWPLGTAHIYSIISFCSFYTEMKHTPLPFHPVCPQTYYHTSFSLSILNFSFLNATI